MISVVGAGVGAADLLCGQVRQSDVADRPATYLANLVVPPVR